MAKRVSGGSRGWVWIGALVLCACSGDEQPPQVAVQVSNLGSFPGRGNATLRGSDLDGNPMSLTSENTTVRVEQLAASGSWRAIDNVDVRWGGHERIDIALVADNSGSESGKLSAIQSASRSVAERVFGYGERSRMGLVRVSTVSKVVQRLTESDIQFDAAVDQLFIRDGWTALWDGVRQGNEVLERGIVTKNPQKPDTCVDAAARGIVVLTDGYENNSADEHQTRYIEQSDGIDTTFEDLQQMSVFRSRTPVFVVGVGDRIDAPRLQKLASSSRGKYQHIDHYQQLRGALSVMTQRISQSTPICFDVDPEATRLRFTIEVKHKRDREVFEQELDIPQDRCSGPDATRVSDYRPLRPLVPCSSELVGVLSSTADLVTVADLGCHDESQASPPLYEQALQEDALVRYQPPTSKERTLLQGILPRFYADLQDVGADLRVHRQALAEADLAVHEYEVDGKRFVVVFDNNPTWRGTGGYVLRRGPVASELIIQAPHTYYEAYTGAIADDLMARYDVRGFFFNTLHRHYLLPGATCTDEVHPADVAHVTNSFFHLMTTSYLTAVPHGTIVQIHGHQNPECAAEGVGTVVSSGTFTPTEGAQQLRAGLGDIFGDGGVALYPAETELYGATLNIQGRWVRAEQRGHFLHLEFSKDVRRALVVSAAARTQLGQALLATSAEAR